MAKFDYKKWVVENKYGNTPYYSHYGSGKLNEQLNPNITTGSNLDDVMFGTGSGDTPNPYYACPTGTTQTDTIPCNNNGYWGAPAIDGQFDWNGNYDSFVSFCCVTGNEATGSVTGSEATSSNYQPFCCDINAINFGQMASGQPYGINPGEPEQYLMINGPQGPMCNNSICQGNVNEPGPQGQGTPQFMRPTPDMEKTPFKDKPKRRNPRDQRNRDQRNRDPRTKRKLNEQDLCATAWPNMLPNMQEFTCNACSGLGWDPDPYTVLGDMVSFCECCEESSTGSVPPPTGISGKPDRDIITKKRLKEIIKKILKEQKASNPCTKADVMKALGNPKNMGQAVQGYTRLYAKHRGTCADGKPLPSPQSVKQKYSSRPNDPVEPKFMIWIMTAIFCIGTYCLTGGYGTWEE